MVLRFCNYILILICILCGKTVIDLTIAPRLP